MADMKLHKSAFKSEKTNPIRISGWMAIKKAGDGGRTHDVKLGKLAFYR